MVIVGKRVDENNTSMGKTLEVCPQLICVRQGTKGSFCKGAVSEAD